LPAKAAIAASKRGQGETADAPLVQMRSEVVQALLDVGDARWRTPVPLGREIEDPSVGLLTIQVRLADTYPAIFAAGHVILEHGRITLLELLRDTLAHHADTVDRIHQNLCLASEQIADECLEHGSIRQRKNN